MVEGGIALSLIALVIMLIICAPQVGYGLATQFSLGTFNHTGLEKRTQAFLDDLQQKGGPPIYTLSPEKARAVLSGLQASTPVKKLPAGIDESLKTGINSGVEATPTFFVNGVRYEESWDLETFSGMLKKHLRGQI